MPPGSVYWIVRNQANTTKQDGESLRTWQYSSEKITTGDNRKAAILLLRATKEQVLYQIK